MIIIIIETMAIKTILMMIIIKIKITKIHNDYIYIKIRKMNKQINWYKYVTHIHKNKK